jgi:tRNA U34 5-carboxymethylaminomethyl modifying GTPase MnmE/TrmE
VVVVNKTDLEPAWTARELAAAVRDPGFGGRDAIVLPAHDRRPGECLGGNAQGARAFGGATEDPGGEAPGVVSVSLRTGAGVDALRGAMRAALEVGEPLRDGPLVSNVRHEMLLRQARESLARASDNLVRAGESASEDLLLADLAEARRAFEEVTGRRTSEDVLRRIFERFCVGK